MNLIKKIALRVIRAWRLILVIAVALAVVAALGWGIFWGVNKIFFKGQLGNNGPTTTRQVLVSVHDFSMPDPVEDKKTSIKMGYVVGVYPEDHQWSDTEKISFLILKMKLNDTEASELTAPLTQAIKNPTEQQKEAAKNDPQAGTETVSAREFKINMAKIGFTGDASSLAKGQPFLDKVFDWGIVEKVK